jgi:hypothetical protein
MRSDMDDFNLNLATAEEELDGDDATGSVVLGVLDGSTDPSEWIQSIEDGNVLVLAIEGDLNELATGFARDVKDMGGSLMHFRSFLVVSPPGIEVNTDRL